MHALLVVAHPRTDSLTARVAARARESLETSGYTVDLLDLHAEGFDPRMTPEDEPDWTDRDKAYSPEVRAHMARVEAADAIVVVFPVWWFGLPAILKGWIDRVWNYGFAYGRRPARLAAKRMHWIGLTGYTEEVFVEGGWNDLLERTLKVGVSAFCAIEDTEVTLIHGAVPDTPTPAHPERILTTAANALTAFLTPTPTTR
ncbi:NAD(P)H oxidoreductase [Bailinhaonella thermotolerans]|uniref:NAD(P)H oxidoreductase n=1 Tax=Bailinhaonella thermotolerans TaxID=1070861 RepID=A0A3A4B5M6_9ACTN|nr:NAD(P)H oxidoreductase [Bailinhaonella thermotolerans]RJL33351.1 NAD(P)H oxidoreductase [Bailinhaonella thermotolerans]